MLEFLEANWSLLVFGALFLLMMRMHAGGHGGAHGGGCGGGHTHSDRQNRAATEAANEPSEGEPATTVGGRPTRRSDEGRSGGCH